MSVSEKKQQNPVPIIAGAVGGVGVVLAILFFALGHPLLGGAAVLLALDGIALGYVLPKAGLGESIFGKKQKTPARQNGDNVIRPVR